MRVLIAQGAATDEIRLVARKRGGGVASPILHDRGYVGDRFQHIFLYRVPLGRLEGFQIERQRSFGVEFLRVRLKPND